MSIAIRAWGNQFAAAIMLLCLVGCAVPVPESGNASQTEFLRYGRFALKAEDFNRDPEAVQGGFTWRDTGVRFSLDLTDPMGSVIARIVVERAGATLTRSNGEQIYAKTPDALLQTVLGQTVPVDGLRSWLHTIKSPPAGMTMVFKDPEGRIQTFEQSGWRVQLSRFDELGPQLLVLTHREGSKNIVIRLVVDKP